MTPHRNERIAVAVGVVVVALFVALFVTGAEDSLGRQPWFSNGANVIQWLSGPATLAAVGMVAYGFFVRRCAAPLCVRRGEHEVAGTLKKVCHHHHTRAAHELCHDLFAEEHRLAGRLGFGESHDRPVDGGAARPS